MTGSEHLLQSYFSSLGKRILLVLPPPCADGLLILPTTPNAPTGNTCSKCTGRNACSDCRYHPRLWQKARIRSCCL
ncbi:hypothetical protein FKM82_023410 [Ascaphus truei]